MKDNFTIKSLSKDDRPREKMLSKGKNFMTDSELLAILLNSGSRKESALSLAQRILNNVNNNLDQLGELSEKQLMSFKGVGEAKALKIMAALELGKRRNASNIIQKNSILTSKEAYNFISVELDDLKHEEFWIILLNIKNQILAKIKIGEGSNVATIVDIKKIFRHVIEYNATSFIVCHNHPSGETTPSNNDLKLTSNIKKAAELFNANLIDHIICGKKNYYSFVDNNNLI